MFDSLRMGKNGASNVPPVRPWTDYDVELADKMSSCLLYTSRCV